MPGQANSPFGANDWLVDELYQQYLEDKQSVDPAWWEFFADYSPSDFSPLAAANKSVLQPRVSAPAPAASSQNSAPASTTPATSATSATPSTPSVPSAPSQPAPAANPAPVAQVDDVVEKLKGTSARVVTNMEASLEIK